MCKLRLAVLCWLLAGSCAFAQNDTQAFVVPVNECYLKLNPLSPFEIEGGIGISAEYILVKQKLGFQLEVQPLLFTVYKNYDIERPANTIEWAAPFGIKLRPEVRYYLDGLRSKKYRRRTVLRADGVRLPRKIEPRAYAAIDFLYKYTQREVLGNLNVNNGGTMPGFRQRATYKDIKRVTGFDIKLGAVSSISNSNRWLIEAFVGLGYRHKNFSYKNLPVGVSEPERGRSFRLAFGVDGTPRDRDSERNGFSLPAGIKLIYRL